MTAAHTTADLRHIIETETDLQSPRLKEAVQKVLSALDAGQLRAAEKCDGQWMTNGWVKQAIITHLQMTPIEVIPSPFGCYDKIMPKFYDWDAAAFRAQNVRVSAGAVVRHGAYIEPKAVLMPCFINVGGYVGEHTLIDTWATVGSCAQVGKRCHISGGTGLGGVLEPVNANPVIIEDDCFIGARSEIVEGVIVEQGAVIAMGTFIGQSTKIVDRETGAIVYGRVPAYSVVVPGSLPSRGGVNLACAVIVKRVDEKTRAKVSINALLRD